MSELVEKQFPVKSLLTGLRSIGYNFSTAVADIIDNSISAEATEINIFSDPLADVPYFCILDNGYGMNSKELDNAMLPGSDRTGKEDSELELGRFGLGLKSASLSQCKEFIVASKKFGKIRAMSFDLDVIAEKNKLFLKQLTESEIAELPKISELKKYESGTLVIWTKFDKIEELAKNFEESFRTAVAESKKHVELVFHRFYNQIEIFYNNRRIEKRDPFLLDSVGRQQTGRTSTIDVDNSVITVIPYTLPFANTLTAEEKALLGHPKSIYDEQGFYLYRNKRLISWGSWMRMGIRSELNKLARIQVDIPSTLDSVWTLDVKKSSAKIPDKIKERIRMSIEDSISRSKRTTKFPGAKEQSVECKVWQRINEHEGKIKYQINREIPALIALNEALGENEKRLLEIALSQIECYLPKYSITNDNMDALNIINSGDGVDEERLIEEIRQILLMCSPDDRDRMFDSIFMAEGYQKLFSKKEIIHRRLFENE
ncbi:MAG: ATP-binding protein [Clostridiales bacterium]|nr:ATP-binding protein [Clostridiales bacterium]